VFNDGIRLPLSQAYHKDRKGQEQLAQCLRRFLNFQSVQMNEDREESESFTDSDLICCTVESSIQTK
jgi:hypothetical protein